MENCIVYIWSTPFVNGDASICKWSPPFVFGSFDAKQHPIIIVAEEGEIKPYLFILDPHILQRVYVLGTRLGRRSYASKW